MTLRDWIGDTTDRYRTESLTTATRNSGRELLRGGLRHVGKHCGHSIWSDEWDVLIVLDACRYDLMQEVAPEYESLPTEVGSWWSNASCSIDWIIRNFNECPAEAAQAGYITGNPFTAHSAADARSANVMADDVAHLERLYETHWQPIDGGPVETIPPKVLTDHAINAWRRRDELGMNQLVIHYMQPHQPYKSRPDWSAIGRNLKDLVENETKAGACAWQECRKGNIDREELWRAYRENLRWVLDDVTERLLPNVEGDVVLTADHGNAMGEWGDWAHPPGALCPAVRKVPWLEVACTDEETVAPELAEPEAGRATSDQLKALGYM